MAFTLITLTGGPFTRPDGSYATGTLTATLSEQLVNGTDIADPTPITGILNASGMLKNSSGEQALELVAVDDVGTSPQGAVYEFLLELDSAPLDPFTAAIAHAAPSGTIDISTLM